MRRGQGKKARKQKSTGVNWGEPEKKVGTSDKSFQRPIICKKIDGLAQYYSSCRESDALPAIPGSVILTTDQPVTFSLAARRADCRCPPSCSAGCPPNRSWRRSSG